MDKFIDGLTSTAQNAANTSQNRNVATSALEQPAIDLDDISEAFSKSFQDMVDNDVLSKVIAGAMSESIRNIGLVENGLENMLKFYEPVPSLAKPKFSNIFALDGKISLPTLYIGNKLDDIIKAIGVNSKDKPSVSKKSSLLKTSSSDKQLNEPISKGKNSLLEGLNLFKNVALIVGTFVVAAVFVQAFGVTLGSILKIGLIFGMVATIIKLVPSVIRGANIQTFKDFALASVLVSIGIMAISLVSRFMPISVLGLVFKVLLMVGLIKFIALVIKPSSITSFVTFAIAGALIGIGLLGLGLGIKALLNSGSFLLITGVLLLVMVFTLGMAAIAPLAPAILTGAGTFIFISTGLMAFGIGLVALAEGFKALSSVTNLFTIAATLIILAYFIPIISVVSLLALPGSLGMIALGVGLVAVAYGLDAISKINPMTVISTLPVLLLFMLTIGVAGYYVGLGMLLAGTGMISLGLGLASMSFGLKKISELNLEALGMFKTLGVLLVFLLTIGIIGYAVGPSILQIGLGMISLGLGLWFMGIGLKKLSELDPSKFWLSLLIIGVFLLVMSAVSTSLLAGGLGLILIGVGFVLIASGLKSIMKASETTEKLQDTLIALGLFLGAMAIVGILSPLIALAAYSMILIGLSFLVFGLGLWKIVTIGKDGFKIITGGIVELGKAFSTYANKETGIGIIVFLIASAALWVLGTALEKLKGFDEVGLAYFISSFGDSITKFGQPGVFKGILGLVGAGIGLWSMVQALNGMDASKLKGFSQELAGVGDAFKHFSLKDALFVTLGPAIRSVAEAMQLANGLGKSTLPQFIKDFSEGISSITNFNQFKSRLKTVSKGMKDLAKSIEYLEDSADFLKKGGDLNLNHKESISFIDANKDSVKELVKVNEKLTTIIGKMSGDNSPVDNLTQPGQSFNADEMLNGLDLEGMIPSMG